MFPRTLIVLVASLLLTWSSPSRGLAGDAVFSSDGKQIYGITQTPLNPDGKTYAEQDYKPAVEEIDLGAKTIRHIITTEHFRGIACTDENRFFCTTESALHAFDPKSGTLTKIRDAAPGAAFWRVAYDPKSRALFVTTDDEANPLFMFKLPDEYVDVRMRRHPCPSSLVFARNGELFSPLMATFGTARSKMIKATFGWLRIDMRQSQPWRQLTARPLKSVSPISE
jgi:hypothetical protein